jgi:hypothetical protein
MPMRRTPSRGAFSAGQRGKCSTNLVGHKHPFRTIVGLSRLSERAFGVDQGNGN